jgi:hypothetical protein
MDYLFGLSLVAFGLWGIWVALYRFDDLLDYLEHSARW